MLPGQSARIAQRGLGHAEGAGARAEQVRWELLRAIHTPLELDDDQSKPMSIVLPMSMTTSSSFRKLGRSLSSLLAAAPYPHPHPTQSKKDCANSVYTAAPSRILVAKTATQRKLETKAPTRPSKAVQRVQSHAEKIVEGLEYLADCAWNLRRAPWIEQRTVSQRAALLRALTSTGHHSVTGSPLTECTPARANFGADDPFPGARKGSLNGSEPRPTQRLRLVSCGNRAECQAGQESVTSSKTRGRTTRTKKMLRHQTSTFASALEDLACRPTLK
jgi:hypothetical protein